MNRKGQLVSLDLLFSLILVALALGLVFRTAELSLYTGTDQDIVEEVRVLAEGAADRLTHAASATCTLADGAGAPLRSLPHCVDTAKVAALSDADLGIPAGYSVLVEALEPGGSPSTLKGAAPAPDEEDRIRHKAAALRWVVLQSPATGDESKQDLLNCVDAGGGCNLVTRQLRVKVWKVPP